MKIILNKFLQNKRINLKKNLSFLIIPFLTDSFIESLFILFICQLRINIYFNKGLSKISLYKLFTDIRKFSKNLLSVRDGE
jgi:hypothetical protein